MIAAVNLWRLIRDPLHADGYQFWSGIGAGSPVFVAIGLWLRHHNCRHPGCPWLGHPDPEHGRPVCRRHHPHAAVSSPETGERT